MARIYAPHAMWAKNIITSVWLNYHRYWSNCKLLLINKAVVDIKTARGLVCPLVISQFKYRPWCEIHASLVSRFVYNNIIWPTCAPITGFLLDIMGRHDVVHKLEVHYISQCRHGKTEPRATAIGTHTHNRFTAHLEFVRDYYYRFSQPRDHLQWRLVLGY